MVKNQNGYPSFYYDNHLWKKLDSFNWKKKKSCVQILTQKARKLSAKLELLIGILEILLIF